MRTRFLYITILIGLLSVIINAQQPLSFRNKALGGIINDDLDLIYDPIELRFVDSLRLYTNLSNLTSGTENVFNNVGDNEFLLGISGENPFLSNHWMSGLFRFANSTNPNPVTINSDLNNQYFVQGSGQLDDDYTEYLVGTNGLNYLKREINQSVLSHTKNNDYSFIFNNSLLVDDFTYGLRLELGNRNTEDINSSTNLGTGNLVLFGAPINSPSFHRSVNEFYIDSNYTRLNWSEDGTFNTAGSDPFFQINGSFMAPVAG
jgi:hypothetical protein